MMDDAWAAFAAPQGSGAVEPELQGPLPRRPHRRKGRGTFITFVHVFILPHTLIGLGLVAMLLFGVAHALCGRVVPASVIGRDKSVSRKGGVSYTVSFGYDLDGVARTGRQSVSQEVFARSAKGTPIEVKVLAAGGMVRADIVGTWGAFPLPINLGAALFWNGVLFAFHWQLTILPLLRRRLVASGRAVVGRVVDRRVQRGKGVTCTVRYAYVTALGESLEREMTVRAEDHDRTRVGDAVTVLYDPRRPRRSVVYRYGDYEARSGA